MAVITGNGDFLNWTAPPGFYISHSMESNGGRVSGSTYNITWVGKNLKYGFWSLNPPTVQQVLPKSGTLTGLLFSDANGRPIYSVTGSLDLSSANTVDPTFLFWSVINDPDPDIWNGGFGDDIFYFFGDLVS